ncbi:MAG: hypothetical protein VKQ33_16640, partial [Candidatus Sericytochromatia bacterium]|nr:hypothetical protein [Candidatus Sericytochromatia bacterium]
MKDAFIVILIGVLFFGLSVLFITENAQEADVQVDDRYNQTYQKLLDDERDLQGVQNTLENFSTSVEEAKLGDFAYYGFKGILSIMKAPFQILNIAKNSVSVVGATLDFVPQIVLTTASAVIG